MSILISNNLAAEVRISNIFSQDQSYPLTICCWVKGVTWPPSGTRLRTLIALKSNDNSLYLRNSIYQNGGTQRGPRILGNGADFPDSKGATYWRSNPIDTWMPVIGVWENTTSRRLYTTDENSDVIEVVGPSDNRTMPSLRDLLLFEAVGNTWTSENIKAANFQIYTAAFSEANAIEYIETNSVTDLSPYFKLDTYTDWAGGNLEDLSGNGNNVTPGVNWVYSDDEPLVLQSLTPDYTARKGSTVTITHTLTADGITTATLNGETVTIGTQSGQDADIDLDETAITTSGEYDLVLGDGTDTETFTVQYNVIGLATNTLQKEGDALADLSDVRITVLNAAGTRLDRQTGLTTNGSGVTGTTIVAAGDPGDAVEVSYYSASEEAGITFVTALELL